MASVFGRTSAAGEKVVDMPDWASRLIPDHDGLPVDQSAPPVVIIDGHYIIFRSFHAMPSLSSPDGTPVGALVGFCNVINKLVSDAPAVARWESRPKVDVFVVGYPHRASVCAGFAHGPRAELAPPPRNAVPQKLSTSTS